MRKELAAGPVIASAPGYTLSYNTLDNGRAPTQGMLVEFKQDLAGVGGDVHNVKSTIDARIYNEILPDIVGVLRGQAGYAVGFDGSIRMLDEFQSGPSLVRGFQPTVSARATSARSSTATTAPRTRWAARSTGRRHSNSRRRCR